MMNRFVSWKPMLVVAGLIVAAFFLWSSSVSRKTRMVDASTPPSSETPITQTSNEARPHFIVAKNCARCHSNSDQATAMRDSQDLPIAPYDLWETSTMANSARDPFWKAVLSAEIAATPSLKGALEEKCTRCHAPMAAPAPESPPGEVLAYLKKQDQRSELGLDGVSCAVCHQITPTGLGTAVSFTGHFEITNESKIYGPHADPFTRPMQNNVGFTPTESAHILKPGLCATCHTVITESVDADGSATDHHLHEQVPYLEWRNSVFNDELEQPNEKARSCQACHMPTQDDQGGPIATRLAHNPMGRDFPFLKARQPFGKHSFLGANVLMKRILRDNAQELGVAASFNAFEESIDRSLLFLKTETAKLEFKSVEVDNQKLVVSLSVENLAGHKFPTAYPSRRAWIQFKVQTAEGKTIFASGQFNSRGELIDAKGSVLTSELAGGPIVPHFDILNQPDQVQIYEAIMSDAKDQPTFSLLRGAAYHKDNRLLPEGWNSNHADAAVTRPAGIGDDSNFLGGHDLVKFEIDLPNETELVISAQLFYQVISPRHADELFRFETPEVRQFQKMFEVSDRQPIEIDSQHVRWKRID